MLGICIHGSKEITPNLQWQHPVKWKPCRNALSHAGELKDDMKAEDWQVSWPCATYADLGGPGQIAAFCGGFAALDALTFYRKFRQIPTLASAGMTFCSDLQQLQRRSFCSARRYFQVWNYCTCFLSWSAAGLLQQRGLLQRWPYILQQFAAVAVHFAVVQRDICSAKKKFKYQEFPHLDLSKVGI